MAVIAPPPNAGDTVLDPSGLFTTRWYRFINQIWEKLGGAIDRFEVNAPPGQVSAFAGSSAPNGWLLCDGSAVNRIAYAELFAVIDVTYGAGDGTTTFNLPDARGRSLIGVGTGPSLSPRALADTGGAENVALTTAELAQHGHTLTDTGHTHTVTDTGHTHGITDPGHSHGNADVDSGAGVGVYTSGAVGDTVLSTTTETTGITADSATTGVTNQNATTGITLGDTGSGNAHENMMPFLALNAIIKT